MKTGLSLSSGKNDEAAVLYLIISALFYFDVEQCGRCVDNLWIKKWLNQAAVDDVDNLSGKKCYEKIFLREKESEILSTKPRRPNPSAPSREGEQL